MCGWLLTAISWFVVIVTLPFSLCVCFKVNRRDLQIVLCLEFSGAFYVAKLYLLFQQKDTLDIIRIPVNNKIFYISVF